MLPFSTDILFRVGGHWSSPVTIDHPSRHECFKVMVMFCLYNPCGHRAHTHTHFVCLPGGHPKGGPTSAPSLASAVPLPKRVMFLLCFEDKVSVAM